MYGFASSDGTPPRSVNRKCTFILPRFSGGSKLYIAPSLGSKSPQGRVAGGFAGICGPNPRKLVFGNLCPCFLAQNLASDGQSARRACPLPARPRPVFGPQMLQATASRLGEFVPCRPGPAAQCLPYQNLGPGKWESRTVLYRPLRAAGSQLSFASRPCFSWVGWGVEP